MNTTQASAIEIICPIHKIALLFDSFKALASTYAGTHYYGLYCGECDYKI